MASGFLVWCLGDSRRKEQVGGRAASRLVLGDSGGGGGGGARNWRGLEALEMKSGAGGSGDDHSRNGFGLAWNVHRTQRAKRKRTPTGEWDRGDQSSRNDEKVGGVLVLNKIPPKMRVGQCGTYFPLSVPPRSRGIRERIRLPPRNSSWTFMIKLMELGKFLSPDCIRGSKRKVGRGKYASREHQ
jgi:hypothetical protein